MDLSKAIEKARYNLNDPYIDESGVKQYVIMPLLYSLGWDIYDRSEVKPEYRTSRGLVDYALFLRNKVVVFLEIKKPSENLHYHEDQLLRYAYSEGVRLACLTNGKDWWFYLPLEEGPWEKRKFLEVSINEHGFQGVIEDILSKGSISAGASQSKAKSMLYVANHLPDIFLSLFREPDDLIVELIKEKFHERYRLDVDKAYIITFLKSIAEKLPHVIDTSLQPISGEKDPKTGKKRSFDTFVLHLSRGDQHTFGTISDLTIFLFNYMETKRPGFFIRFYREKHGKSRKYISTDKYELYKNRPDLSESQSKRLINGWYIGTNYSVRDFKKMISLACRVENIKCNFEENDNTLTVRVYV